MVSVSSRETRLRRLLFECPTVPAPVLIIGAHPDDETLGASAVIAAQAPMIIQVTDGAPNNPADWRKLGFRCREAYAGARRSESLRALATAGVRAENLVQLGFVDQESSFDPRQLISTMAALLEGKSSFAVFTHPYEGGHPDHDATALAVHAAMALLPMDNRPSLYEFTSYHASANGLETLEFLGIQTEVNTIFLSPEQCERKRRMLACYETQRETLSQFAVSREKFRPAPKYVFTQAPHPGRLHYENYEWKITGDHWRALARQALQDLHLEKPL